MMNQEVEDIVWALKALARVAVANLVNDTVSRGRGKEAAKVCEILLSPLGATDERAASKARILKDVLEQVFAAYSGERQEQLRLLYGFDDGSALIKRLRKRKDAAHYEPKTLYDRAEKEHLPVAQALVKLLVDWGTPSEPLLRLMEKQLFANRWANLMESGHAGEDRVKLADVLVDLPLAEDREEAGLIEETLPPADSSARLSMDIEEAGSTRRLPPTHRLLRRADQLSEKFLNRFLTTTALREELTDSPSGEAPQSSLVARRIVLLGGPGSGKTTLTRFLCQLLRASFLRHRNGHFYEEAESEIEATLRAGKREGLPGAPPWFAIQIPLTDFASHLTLHQPTDSASIPSYIASTTSEKFFEVGVREVSTWFASNPAVLVLDGWDEIPVSSNRKEVQDAIEASIVDLAQRNRELYVIVTSRPQAYHRDFPSLYKHLRLRSLEPREALEYGYGLARVRHEGDPDSEGMIQRRLNRAVTKRESARLMTTPLNVTFMALLVERVGRAPEDRWKLYSEWYEQILKREQARSNPLAELLSKYEDEIEIAHQNVALMLQGRAEVAGGTEPHLTTLELQKAFTEVFRAETELDGTGLRKLVRDLVEVAQSRLVLLVSDSTGAEGEEWGFEHATLREFMAAGGITSTGEEALSERLLQLACRPYWHNVALFCVDRITKDWRWLRGTVLQNCAAANDYPAGLPARAVLRGSELALQFCNETKLGEVRQFATPLARLACRLLDLPGYAYGSNLGSLCDCSAGPEILLDELRTRLKASGACRPAFACLSEVVDRGHLSPQEALNDWLPTDLSDQRDALCERTGDTWQFRGRWNNSGSLVNYWAVDRMFLLPASQATELLESAGFLWGGEGEEAAGHVNAPLARSLAGYPDRTLSAPILNIQYDIVDESGEVLLSPEVESIFDRGDEAAELLELVRHQSEPPGGVWAPLLAQLEFLASPTKTQLKSSLHRWADSLERQLIDSVEANYWFKRAPWPIAIVLWTVHVPGSPLSPEKIRTLADSSAMGEPTEWQETEASWQGKQVTLESAHGKGFCQIPGKNVTRRPPWMGRHLRNIDFVRLLASYRGAKPGRRNETMAGLLIAGSGTHNVPTEARVSPTELLTMWEDARKVASPLDLGSISAVDPEIEWSVEVCRRVDEFALNAGRVVCSPINNDALLHRLARMVHQRSSPGLMAVLFFVAAHDGRLRDLVHELPAPLIEDAVGSSGLTGLAGSGLIALRSTTSQEQSDEFLSSLFKELEHHELLDAWLEAALSLLEPPRLGALALSLSRLGVDHQATVAFSRSVYDSGVGSFSSSPNWDDLGLPSIPRV